MAEPMQCAAQNTQQPGEPEKSHMKAVFHGGVLPWEAFAIG